MASIKENSSPYNQRRYNYIDFGFTHLYPSFFSMKNNGRIGEWALSLVWVFPDNVVKFFFGCCLAVFFSVILPTVTPKEKTHLDTRKLIFQWNLKMVCVSAAACWEQKRGGGVDCRTPLRLWEEFKIYMVRPFILKKSAWKQWCKKHWCFCVSTQMAPDKPPATPHPTPSEALFFMLASVVI